MAPPPYINIIIIFLVACLLSQSHSNAITLSLAPLQSSKDLKLAASASLSRAQHLKYGNKSGVTSQLYPKSYGAYSIELSFGSPAQSIPLVFDTGSSLTWVPCTLRYVCYHCVYTRNKIKTFLPKLSATAELLGCSNPKCGYLFSNSTAQSRCPKCNPLVSQCSQTCPAYILQYGSGSTAGFALLDNLDFPTTTVSDFLFGCSILSVRQPSGIAGFGRGNQSLPSQMALKRFSYCLLSHHFDDSPQSSDLFLQTTSSGHTKTSNVTYTPFHRNPSSNNSAFQEYYYIPLRKILVGAKSIEIPLSYLEFDSQGNGGTIVDSGSTFTYMEQTIYDLVTWEFVRQMGNYSRAKAIEAESGLSPCYHLTSAENVKFPSFTFKFKGGAKMALPLANYFSLIEGSDAVCLTVVSDGGDGAANVSGPAVILGNYQQQNFYVEYDLENERFGFRPQNCTKKP